MTTDLTAPLLDIVKRAGENKLEGLATKVKRRFVNCSDEILLVCDCSGSMDDLIGSADLTKWDHLKIAVKDVLLLYPKIRLIAFASFVREVKTVDDLPVPAGGTGLARALKAAMRHRPRKTIIISDGLPDDEEEAIQVAGQLTGSIDTIYCGPDSHPAVEFLRKLAHDTGGIQVVWDGYKATLSSAVRGLLAAPTQPHP